MKLDAVLFICDKPNANGRVYSRALAHKLSEEFHDRVEVAGQMNVCGQMGMPEDGRLLMTNISHVVRELKVMEVGEDWGLVATIETLPHAPAGKVLSQLLENEETRKLYVFRTAGTGTITVMPDGTTKINEDFRLDSVNLVPAKDAA